MRRNGTTLPSANTPLASRQIRWTRRERSSTWHKRISPRDRRTKRRKPCWRRSKLLPATARHRNYCLNCSGSREQRSEEHTSELQSRLHLVCRLLLEKKKNKKEATIDVFAITPTAVYNYRRPHTKPRSQVSCLPTRDTYRPSVTLLVLATPTSQQRHA